MIQKILLLQLFYSFWAFKKTSEKPKTLAQLTVSNVCQRAGVSRMAFYRNFDSINQVIYQYYQPRISESFEIIRQNVSATIKIENQLKFFEDFKNDLYLSESQGYEPIIRQIYIEEIENFTKKQMTNISLLLWQLEFMLFGENG